jgi:hypothetical protein
MPTQSVHIRLPAPHIRLLDKLARKLGLDRTSVLKLALYRLGVDEGFALEYRRDD